MDGPATLLALETITLGLAALRRSDGGPLARAHTGEPDNTYGLPVGGALADELKKWFALQQKAVLDAIPKHPLAPVPDSVADLTHWDDPMAAAFTPYLSAEWDQSGKEVAGRLGLDPAAFDVQSPHLKKKIESAALAFSQSTNATTGKQIGTAVKKLRKALAEGLAKEGESIDLLTARVQGVFENAERWRARRIAATETSRAYHAAQEQADLESGVVAGLELLLSSDACPLCRRIATEAKRVKLGTPFAVIGSNPHYSTIKHPPIHPNCQCSLVEVLLPEYGGPPDPVWSDTLIQPKADPDWKPEPGVAEAKPEPGRKPPVPVPTPVEHKVAPDRVEKPPGGDDVEPDYVPMPPDLDDAHLKTMDLHKVEPTWATAPGKKRSYGGVIFDEDGRVLLREPKNHYDGYVWTFPKGGIDPGEHPVDAGLREVKEEVGVDAAILGLVPGAHAGSTTENFYFLMRARAGSTFQTDHETESMRWVTPAEAAELIGQTTNAKGKARDLGVLKAALGRMEALKADPSLNDPLRAKAPAPAPAPTPKPAKEPKPKKAPAAGAFPADPHALTVVKKLGGSTGAELVEDPATGKRYVRKTGNNPGHLREECLADGAYRDLGVRVPDFRLYETAKGPVKLAEYLDGARTLGDVLRDDPAMGKKALKKLQEHFAVDPHGTPWRVDNGGSFRYRAQGSLKTADQWDGYPTELWSLRDKKVNPQTAGAFGSLTIKDVAAQAGKISAANLKLPAELAGVVEERLRQLWDVASTANLLTGDKFTPEYTDGFCRHTVGIRKAGIAEAMPSGFTKSAHNPVEVVDQAGKPWDHLRGTDSLVARLAKYMESVGAKHATIQQWAGDQAGSSWSERSQAIKRFLADARGADYGKYYWRDGSRPDECGKLLKRFQAEAGGAEAYAAAVQAHHAFTYEMLSRAAFPNKDAVRGTVKLMRTEDKKVMTRYKLKPGDRGVTMERGVAESTSIYRKVSVFGSELTVQHVPLHRVVGTYWQSRRAGGSSGAFMGDGENEFVAILEGVPFDYER